MGMVTKEEIEQVAQLPGKVRGGVFHTDAEYIKNVKGEDGLRKVKEKAKEWGYPIEYEKIEATDWLPVGLRAVSLLAAKEVFGWDDKDLHAMGYTAPQYSFFVKFLMRYFLTLGKTFEKSMELWPTHYSIGSIEPASFSEEEKCAVLRVRDFDLHPALCPYYAGYFLRLAEFASTNKNMRIQETECVSRGGPYHEYALRWD